MEKGEIIVFYGHLLDLDQPFFNMIYVKEAKFDFIFFC